MMKAWIVIGLMGASAVGAMELTNFQVRIVADNVNLRVRPESGTEVVSQVREGQLLSAVYVEGDWLGIIAPTNAGLWIKKQYVKDGVVSGDKVKIRSGPGISFRDVGTVAYGAVLTEIGSRGEWLQVAAPADLVLWVNRKWVQPFQGAPMEAPLIVEESPGPDLVKPTESANGLLPRELPAGLGRDDLAPVLGQGALMERSGTVERVPLAFFRGMDYRLVAMRNQQKVTLCYLRGNELQMPALVDRRFTIKGREYWLNNQRYPVIYPDLITPLPE